jgi:hypothetical protein
VTELAHAPAQLPLRPQDEVECRRCDVHCDKVVHPGACLDRSCPFVYAYEAWGRTYMGCLQKVFDVEIDLDLLQAAQQQQRGGFGGVRARRAPLPMCQVEVSACYELRAPSSTRSRAGARASASSLGLTPSPSHGFAA